MGPVIRGGPTPHRARTAARAVAGGGAALAGLGVAGLGLAGLGRAAAVAADRRNRVTVAGPYPVDDATRRLHDRLLVADLHADTLLWRRDLRRRSARGHVDLPRLREAGVGLQVFAVVTQVPVRPRTVGNRARPDLVTALAVAQGRPRRTWRSRLQRALDAADRLARAADAERGRLVVVRTAADLRTLPTRRRVNPGLVAGLLALEGAQALEGDLDAVDVLHAAGYRMVGLHHFLDNDAGGSAHGRTAGGLTPFGRDLVAALQARRMVVDVAHSSPAAVADVLRVTTAPVIASHTGLRGTHDSPRNLSDDQARGIAATGGLLGIALFAEAVGAADVDRTAQAMRYGADLVGVEHLALGSDFDGAVTTPVDVTGLPQLTGALRRHGFTDAEIAAVMGGNALRVLGAVL